MPRVCAYVLLLFSCGLFWQGCNTTPRQPPTYIHIDSFNFVANPAVRNITLSHQISCVWVYYNNATVGVFDLPATIPVVANGTGTLEVFPGITIDGLNNLTGVYPFYQPDTFTFAAQPGTVINHPCTTSYYSNIKVYNISDFNGGQVNFYLDSGSIPMTITTDSSQVFEGHGSGSIYLTAQSPVPVSIDSTGKSFVIPSGSAFIEFNYKCSVPFYVALQANLSSLISSQPYNLAGIYPSDHWQKFYVSVADFAAQYQGTDYSLYIKAYLPSGSTADTVLLDNVQLITF